MILTHAYGLRIVTMKPLEEGEISMTAHDKLVRQCRDVALLTWDRFAHSPKIDGEPGLDRATRGFDLVSRAVLAEVHRTLKNMTPKVIPIKGFAEQDLSYSVAHHAPHLTAPRTPSMTSFERFWGYFLTSSLPILILCGYILYLVRRSNEGLKYRLTRKAKSD